MVSELENLCRSYNDEIAAMQKEIECYKKENKILYEMKELQEREINNLNAIITSYKSQIALMEFLTKEGCASWLSTKS